MSKLSKRMIRRLIMQEMAKMVDEDKIIPHSDAHRKFDIPSSGRKNSGYPGSIAGDYGGGQVGTGMALAPGEEGFTGNVA